MNIIGPNYKPTSLCQVTCGWVACHPISCQNRKVNCINVIEFVINKMYQECVDADLFCIHGNFKGYDAKVWLKINIRIELLSTKFTKTLLLKIVPFKCAYEVEHANEKGTQSLSQAWDKFALRILVSIQCCHNEIKFDIMKIEGRTL